MNNAFCVKRWPGTSAAILLIIVQLGGCRRQDSSTLNPDSVDVPHRRPSKAQGRDGGRNPESSRLAPKPAGSAAASQVATIRLVSLDSVRQELNLDAIQKKRLAEIEQKR